MGIEMDNTWHGSRQSRRETRHILEKVLTDSEMKKKEKSLASDDWGTERMYIFGKQSQSTVCG